jgi:DNA polymerase-3 subunit chi
LTDKLDDPPQESCLLNLSDDLPPTFSRFDQLVEIVSTDDRDRLPARERFKFYRDRGYAIESRDISGGL